MWISKQAHIIEEVRRMRISVGGNSRSRVQHIISMSSYHTTGSDEREMDEWDWLFIYDTRVLCIMYIHRQEEKVGKY